MKFIIYLLFLHIFKDIKEYNKVIRKLDGVLFGGVILEIVHYSIKSNKFGIPSISLYSELYWKPLKEFISREVLTNNLEYNHNVKTPYVKVWFKIENRIINSIYDIIIIEKIRLNSPHTQTLDSLIVKNKFNSSKK